MLREQAQFGSRFAHGMKLAQGPLGSDSSSCTHLPARGRSYRDERCAFQDRRIQPLCHLSKCPLTSILYAVSANGLANGDRLAEPFANIC